MHVDNVTPQEALQYLESLGVTGRLAEQCVGLVGGALLLLERCAGMVKAGTPFPGAVIFCVLNCFTLQISVVLSLWYPPVMGCLEWQYAH